LSPDFQGGRDCLMGEKIGSRRPSVSPSCLQRHWTCSCAHIVVDISVRRAFQPVVVVGPNGFGRLMPPKLPRTWPGRSLLRSVEPKELQAPKARTPGSSEVIEPGRLAAPVAPCSGPHSTANFRISRMPEKCDGRAAPVPIWIAKAVVADIARIFRVGSPRLGAMPSEEPVAVVHLALGHRPGSSRNPGGRWHLATILSVVSQLARCRSSFPGQLLEIGERVASWQTAT